MGNIDTPKYFNSETNILSFIIEFPSIKNGLSAYAIYLESI
jgi:hypothetical protein